MNYLPAPNRYEVGRYRRTGRSGLHLPEISLGLWHNFGGVDVLETQRAMVRFAFDQGITHFDLANNYGPPPGSAEENFKQLLDSDLRPFRDELVISTKAGYRMWPGPYGEWGSRKYLISSCDQSLKRMGLEYVDIFYSHRPDPNTPLEETMGALDQLVRSGKSLYVGISSYSAEQTKEAAAILKSLGTPCLIHQPVYNILNRWIEDGLTDVLEEDGIGCIPFCPLAQGLLTNRYLERIPEDSRAAKSHGFLQTSEVERQQVRIQALAAVAAGRGVSLAQLALQWVLRKPVITSALIGASSVKQIEENLAALGGEALTSDELAAIDAACAL
ncbi:MAG: aldo/keto reductase [Armatimonadaceae bacterium]